MAQPAPLLAVLTMQIREDLAKLRALRRATTNYNLTLEALADAVNQDLQPLIEAANAIPTPVLLLADMHTWTLAPVFGLVAGQDAQTKKDTFANLDGQLQQVKMLAVVREYARDLTRAYETSLRALQSYDVLKIAKVYLFELARINYRPADYARSLQIVAQVRGLSAVDPSLLDVYLSGPLFLFEEASAGFAYTSTLPDEFSPTPKVFLRYLVEADDKLRGWRDLGAMGIQ